MSIIRHKPSLVRSYSITHPSGRVLLPTQPGWDCIVFAPRGLFTAITDSWAWTVPPHRALIVPDGSRLRIDTVRRTGIRCLYVAQGLHVLGTQVRLVNLAPLTRELIAHAVASAPLDVDVPADGALITLLGDRLAAEPDSKLHLPLPVDSAAERVAGAIMLDPATDLDAVLSATNTSRRTMERRFAEETRMSLGQWRRRARILSAVGMLARGDSVTLVAVTVGYSSPSSFVAAFRSELGSPPREFMLT